MTTCIVYAAKYSLNVVCKYEYVKWSLCLKNNNKKKVLKKTPPPKKRKEKPAPLSPEYLPISVMLQIISVPFRGRVLRYKCMLIHQVDGAGRWPLSCESLWMRKPTKRNGLGQLCNMKLAHSDDKQSTLAQRCCSAFNRVSLAATTGKTNNITNETIVQFH